MDFSKFKRVVFLCVANSARSQMAEAIARKHWAQMAGRSHLSVASAGLKPTQINPFALAALAEIGIDASAQFAKSIDAIDWQAGDLAITLCAEEQCPVLPDSVTCWHWPHPDPADHSQPLELQQQSFAAVRDLLLQKLVV